VIVPSMKLHTVAPYIGKMRPEIASWAVDTVSSEGDLILDPFCGSGTVLLEGWAKNRRVIGTDLNPYACLISSAKLNPYDAEKVSNIDQILNNYLSEVDDIKSNIDLEDVPDWVRSFYNPLTLKDLLGWIVVLKKYNDKFALACLLGIAHHQRPGFLSYPSSHTVPYLRTNKFPISDFPEMYEYRDVFSRLKKKIIRATAKLPILNFDLKRDVFLTDASLLKIDEKVNAIITSPPYMGQLDYARDNRLRLYFLGIDDWKSLNKDVSPSASRFVDQFESCLSSWRNILSHGGKLAILVGTTTNTVKQRLDELVIKIISENWVDYHLTDVIVSEIPEGRRARKNCKGSTAESLLIFEYK